MKWNTLSEQGFVPHPLFKFALIAAVCLSLVMCFISDYDKHPDERCHFPAAVYYQSAFLPPLIGDPAVRDSYSGYGVSYLNYHWIEYFAAGKFSLLFSFFTGENLTAVRLFNVALFIFLAAFFIYKSRSNPKLFVFACLLLISPQIWYVFGYINNDGFALFTALFCVYQIGYEESLFRKFIESGETLKNISGGLLFGLLIGILLTLKSNYLPFLMFVFFWLIYQYPVFNFSAPYFNLQNLKKYAVIGLLALAFLGGRVGMDYYVNGETNFVGLAYINYFTGNSEKHKNKLLEYQEQVADYPLKPSTLENDLENSDVSMKLKAKGYPFSYLFTHWKWHHLAFRSSFGTYGYVSINASNPFYLLFFVPLFLLALSLTYSVLKTRERKIFVEYGLVIFFSVLTIAVSAYLSWSYAVQSQGRYFFPIIAMLSLFIYKNREIVNGRLFNLMIAVMFAVSVYSFIFVGLRQINL